jgi:excisionase family DNA binding protein
MPPILLDGRELAERLGVSHGEVMAWHRRGWIPSLKLGNGRVLFNLDRVTESLRERQRKEVVEC